MKTDISKETTSRAEGRVDLQKQYVHTIRYGPHADQEADLHLPGAARPPVVCLLHGGFWRMPYGRDQMTAIADDLASHGFAVWNLEYRRLGNGRAGWPAILDDVSAGVDYLARLTDGIAELDLDRVVVVGHSAGGHLAFCEAGRRRSRGCEAGRVRLRAAVGLAPITDLALAYDSRIGGEIVAELIGGSPGRYPERYRIASPAEMLPLGVRQLILHGNADNAVPIDFSRKYASAAAASGDPVQLIELPGTGHMEYLDPGSGAHATLRSWLMTFLCGTGSTAGDTGK